MAQAPLPRGFLALPSPTDKTIARLHRKVRLLAVRGLLTASLPGLSSPRARVMASVRSFVTRALADAPELVLSAVGSPDVLPSLLSLQSGALPAQTCLQAVPHLLARLNELGPQVPLLWEGPTPSITRRDDGPSYGFEPPARTLLFAREQLEVEHADGRRSPLSAGAGEPRAFDLAPGVHLCIEDSNPLALVEAHPDKDGNACDLGERSVSDWQRALRQALELVALLPHWSTELQAAGARLVPVGFEPERHLSASYREAPGTVYLTLHPDPLTMAEAIIHETQHGKLNLLSWLDPVLHNGRTTWTRSPVRPDLRPLMGVLLAAHAFVPVSALHYTLQAAGHPITTTARFVRRRAEVRDGNARALAILEDLAEPTKVGQRLLADLGNLHSATVDPSREHPQDHHALPTG
jgi:HEXXH motif-containing protein